MEIMDITEVARDVSRAIVTAQAQTEPSSEGCGGGGSGGT